MSPQLSALHIQSSTKAEEFLNPFDDGEVFRFAEGDTRSVEEYLSEYEGTVSDVRHLYQKAADLRRAFYLAVREFVTDPETWRQIEGDRVPDFEKIADELRAEGVEIKEEAPAA